jgi:hypothetical protein
MIQFNSVVLSSTCIEKPNVHSQEDLLINEKIVHFVGSYYIALICDKCHNSKVGILELLVQKETFADARLTGVVS